MVRGIPTTDQGHQRRAIGGLLAIAVFIFATLASFAGTTINVPADYSTIQAAINAATDGDTIKVAAGTYHEALNVNKSLTIEGAGSTLVTINAAGLSGYNSSGIYVSANNVRLCGIDVVGLKTAAQPRYGIKYGEVSGGSLQDVVVENVYRSGFDLLGASNMTITSIVSQNNGGHGIALTDCNNVTVTDLTTLGNGWQSVSVATWGRYTTSIGTSGIVFQGTINLGEVFQLEQGRYPSGPPEPITFSTNLADGADVTVPASLFTYALFGDDDESPSYQRVYFFDSRSAAESAAAFPAALGHLLVTGRYIQSMTDRSQLYASAGCSIQAAIDASSAGSVVNISAGTYTEPLTFSAADGLTLRGENGSLPVIDGGIVFSNSTAINGIAFEYLYFTGSAASNKMFKMDAASAPIHDFRIEHCVFDGEGVADRIGIYGNKFAGTLTISSCEFKDIYGWAVFDLDGSYGGPPYGGSEYVLSSVTFANNYVHDCDGSISIRGNHATPTAVVDVYGNVIENIGGNDGAIGDQWAGIEINHAAVANVYGNTIQDVEMGAWEGQAIQLWDIADLRLGLNVIADNAQGIWVFGGSPGGAYGHWSVPGGIITLNSITGNADYGIGVDLGAMGGPLDATANWWGSVDGPTADIDADGTPEYNGGGDIAFGNIIYSPWLGMNPDGDPLLPGVQLAGPLLFIVDDIGPEPQALVVPGYVDQSVTGYLNRAIGTANVLPGIDSIEVRHGTYDASEPITDGVNLYSEVGSAAHTFLNGPISINVSNVLLGKMRQGFTIYGDITVGAGIDASSIHINWNDLLGIVSNNGSGTLDAIFNYWGEDGPDTVGNVAVYPLLPIPSDIIIGYMDEHGLSPLDAIDFALLLDLYLSERNALAAVELMNAFGFSAEEAAALVEEYGALAVARALAFCGGDYEDFLALLIGYASGGGGGGSFLSGGAGGTSGIAGFCVGCPIALQLDLVHPVTGEPITDAVVSYSVCRTLEDGTAEIVALGVMSYDGDLGAYTFDVDTSGFVPGIYDVYLGTNDGRFRHFQVEVIQIGV